MNRANSASDVWSKGSADFLQLRRDDAPAGGLAAWLADQVRAAISDGRLQAGATLPPSRLLAEDLGVSRGMITEVYRRLAEDGHVRGAGRAGTVVLSGPGTIAGSPEVRVDVAPADPFGSPPGSGTIDELRSLPARYDLVPGLPDLAAFPRVAWLRAERRVLAELSPADFGYGDARGSAALRVQVAHWLARNRGISVDPNQVLIVAGVAQALALTAEVLMADGISTVAVEDPCSLGAREQLRRSGLATPPVPVDEKGVLVKDLKRTGAPAILLTPAHQFPTGVVLDGARRAELARWSADGGVIIEDDYDAEHRYDRPPVPALRATLPQQVCYAGSVSKLLAPGLRIGWLVAPDRYRDALVDAKRHADLGNAVIAQLVLADLMRSGELERHLRLVRRRHRRRRDVLLASLAEHLPQAKVHGAAAGLHLTVTLPAGIDDNALAARAARSGVKVQPLSWHRQQPGPPGLVIGYAAAAPPDIAAAVAILGQVARLLELIMR